MRKRTRGSETSQYPEEKKSTEIPQVAASERGLAQTVPSTERSGADDGLSVVCWGWGCRTRVMGPEDIVEAIWKGPPEQVIAL